jgi:hypothetical protein
LKNAIEEVNASSNYDFLIVALDADECTPQERLQEIEAFMEKEKLKLENCKLKLLIQNRCFETWFMGNRKVYPRHPKGDEFIEYAKFYNVSQKDPERMGLYPGFTEVSKFHYRYLKEMLLERNIFYTKSRPRGVVDRAYLDQLILRTDDTPHLSSLKDFFDFCKMIGESS